MYPDNYKGLLPDNRGELEKDKDYKHEEVFGSSKVDWLTKKEADKSEKLFPVLDQKNTSACVCYSVVTCLYNTEKEKLSPAYLYTQRKNKPQEGCYYYDIANLVVKQGVVTEKDLKTPIKESLINSVVITPELRKKAEKYKQKAYIFLDNPSIENMGQLANKGIALTCSIFANTHEWSTDAPVATDTITPWTAGINHAITVLPNSAFKHGGIEYIKIQDSAHFGGIVFRDLSKTWVDKRVKHSMYFIDLEKEPSDFPQHLRGYTWNTDLYVGKRGDDVKALQDFLKWKGYFPKNIESTGNFFGITRKAVEDYQF